MGPARADGPRAGRVTDMAGALGHHLGRAGYAVIVEGHGLTARTAAVSARQVEGTVAAVEMSGVDPKTWSGTNGVEIVEAADTFDALHKVLELADAMVLLAGDLHAVALLTQIWSWGLEPDAPYRQVILVGEGWPEAVRTLADAVGLDAKTRAMVTFAKEAPEAVEALRYYVAP